jgi:aldehyde dehydrogenase (NAD+)
MGHIINDFHTNRLTDLLKDHNGRVAIGSIQDGNPLVPTVIVNPSNVSALMKDEIFGPILPIITYETLDEAINYIN